MTSFRSIVQQTFAILPPGDRKKILILIPLLLLQALLDVASVASLAPLAVIILQPEDGAHYFSLDITKSFPFTTRESSALIIVVCVALFFVVKHFISVWISNFKIKFAYQVANSLSQKMANDFIDLSYMKYFDLQTAGELNRIANLPLSFANNVLLALATLFTEGLILALLIISIMFYDWRALLFLCLLALPSAWYYKQIQLKLSAISETLKLKYASMVHQIILLYRSFVEIKLYNKEGFFTTQIKDINQELIDAQITQNRLQANSFRLFETTAALGLCVLIVYLVVSNASQQTIILLLGLYTACGFRAIPSFNRMFNALMQIKTNVYTLEGLNLFNNSQPQVEQESITFNNSITLQNISFHYPEKNSVLKDFTLTVAKGDKVALVGKSGTGKTTLLMLMMQYLLPTSGTITIDNIKLEEKHKLSWQKNISYVPQHPIILDSSVIENIAFGIKPESADKNKILELIQSMELESWLRQLPDGLDTKLGEQGIKISGGQRQRIGIARALYQNAEILLLDEITSHLDYKTSGEILHVLEKLTSDKKTIIMVTHDESFLHLFNKVIRF